MSSLRLKDLSLGPRAWLRRAQTEISGVSLEMKPGEIVALTGQIQPAARHLAALLSGQNAPLGGRAEFDGVDLGRARRTNWRRLRWRIAIWRGAAEAPFSPRLPAMAGLTEQIDTLLPRLDPRLRDAQILSALQRAGLDPDLALRQISSLTSLERVEMSLARALVTVPEVLLAIDPIAGLDPLDRARTLNRLRALAGEGVGIMFLTEDIQAAAQIALRMGVLHAGRMVEYGMAEDIALMPRHPYTQLLLNTSADPLGGNWRHPRRPGPLPSAEPVILRPLRDPPPKLEDTPHETPPAMESDLENTGASGPET